jgi:NAD(P)-dependent dehydrogenase (short-subunit alcohol dehydrogenase family)
VDVLVNNAGILGPRVPIAEVPVNAWAEVMDVNVDGAFHAVRAFVPAMLRAGAGSVVTVTSGVGNVGRPSWGAYGVSKFALEGLGYALAAELRGTGVRSNLVNPAAIRTGMRAAAYPDEDPDLVRTPEEVTEVFVFLASDESRGVEGRRLEARDWVGGPPPDPETGA